MPYIIKNGLTYTGNLMPITQVQYDALSEAEKNNGIAYFIVDSDAVLDASDVGLGEGNVEDLAGSVAMIETSPATATHAVEDFILWNGQLYEVTAPIAVGETLTVGTNITAKTVGGELTTLKNGLTPMTTGSVSPTSAISTATVDQNECSKSGGIVTASARAYNFSKSATGEFFVIPDGFRPRSVKRGMGLLVINNVSIPILCTVDTYGSVSMNYSSGQTATQAAFTITYHI